MFNKNNRTIACLLLSMLSFVCFMVAGLSIGVKAKTNTVSYSVGNDGIYVTESFDNAVSYKTKTDATIIPDSAETYGKTLSKMLTVKLSESIDINKGTSEWDGFLIHLSFSARFRFYMWLGSVENVDGQEKITVSRNYNSKTQRYEKFLDKDGKDLSVEEKGVYTNSGYCLSTGALSGTWVYNFSDIIVKLMLNI